MAKIQNETEYKALMARVEELLLVTTDDSPKDSREVIELEMLADLVEEYELEHYPIGEPTLIDVIRLRMYEMDLNQVKLAELLGVSRSRVSEYINGKSEPTLKVAREISRKLNIDADIVLGL